jgi:hypothetical protein
MTLDGEAMAAAQPSPRLGEHTAEIAREIGDGLRRDVAWMGAAC